MVLIFIIVCIMLESYLVGKVLVLGVFDIWAELTCVSCSRDRSDMNSARVSMTQAGRGDTSTNAQ